MNQLFKGEKGISLTEVLAAIVITAMISTAIMSFHVFMQTKAHEDTKRINGLSDITIAFKRITKDLRMALPDNIKVSGNAPGGLTIIMADDTEITYQFDAVNGTLLRNNAAYIINVADFSVSIHDQVIDLSITNNTGKKLQTEIVKRKGDMPDDEASE